MPALDAPDDLADRVVRVAGKLARWLAPPDTLRGHLRAAAERLAGRGLAGLEPVLDDLAARSGPALWRWPRDLLAGRAADLIGAAAAPAPLAGHTASADIVVCVHNALDDVRRCLASVVRYTRPPYGLILVDDASGPETAAYLARFAEEQGAALERNAEARGYTVAANQGLRRSAADYVVLLNSDTVVTSEWLDRLIACAESNPRVGLAGPLSNTASWQSAPELFDAAGDWAENPLPAGLTLADLAEAVAESAGRLYPRLAFLNGFCLLIRRRVLETVGLFDEAAFGAGYGEENDYALRARAAGWRLAVADDAYVYHAQSRSYSHERRRQLSERAQAQLEAKHGRAVIAQGVAAAQADRVLAGARARLSAWLERRRLCEAGRVRWEGRRLLIPLPVRGPGGGANVVIQEALAMQAMGVEVTLLNLAELRAEFEAGYPGLRLPVQYVGAPDEIAALAARSDAVLATHNLSVGWLAAPDPRRWVRGYYIQDFEPWFFPEGSAARAEAQRSYTLWPDLVRVTKTEWTRRTVLAWAGVDCAVAGPSVDLDLFRPRPRRGPDWPRRPLRVAAMVRPESPRRQPELTMEVLRAVARAQGGRVEVVVFGVAPEHPAFRRLRRDFAFRNFGVLAPAGMAHLLNEVDLFADFSAFQAMGLTALEAMACGAAVIVPAEGGSRSFARPEENCLEADTRSVEACQSALERLITDHDLRARLARQALADAARFHPEQAAFRVLSALWPEAGPC